MIRDLSLLLLILIVPVSASGETFERDRSCFNGFWDRETEPAASVPPSGFDEALVREHLGIEGRICGWAVKAWGRDERLFVAVVEQKKTVSIGVFEKGESIRLRARSRLDAGKHQKPYFLKFDFAPYRINLEETAIGIRMAKPIAYAGGGGQCETVSLFRLGTDRLDLILHTQINYSAMVRGDPIERGGPSVVHDVYAKATLAISERKTSGFFDYIRSAEVSTPFTEPSRRRATYAWSDGRYRSRGDAAPLETNCLTPGFDMIPGHGESESFPVWVAQSDLAPVAQQRSVPAAGRATPAQATETKTLTSIESLTVGADGAQVTFRGLRSTCGAFWLTMGLTASAADVSRCLGESEERHIAIELDAGRLAAARLTPDDGEARCVAAALGSGKLNSLSCSLEAHVSR